jgi:predicted thioesterase
MKESLKPGLSLTRRVTIDAPRTIDFLGESLRVYATPELVRDIELTCRELVLAHCAPGEDSVGTGIGITHGGATLLGMWVEISATVRAVEGRKVTFDVVARDAVEEVSRGEHGRFVVEVDKLRARVAAKAEKAA